MPGTNPLSCSHAEMVYSTSASKILLLDTGNYPGQSNYLNETVTWSGDAFTGNWTIVSTSQIDPLGPLPVRSQFGMGYDSSSTEIVMFGGQGGSETAGIFQDTWTWNGTVWQQQTPGTSPFGRYRHQMADLHGVGTLMFGGSNVLNFLEETWLWQGGVGGNWTQLSPGVVPPARVDFAMAGSSAATIILMYGGKGTNSCFGDTWIWSGTATGDWIHQTPGTQPPYLADSCMCYDASNSTFVMFGGQTDDGLLPPETWIWTGGNGGNWTLAKPAVSPPGRVGAQMSYDGTHVIMFGGYGTAQNLFNHTWVWEGGATPATTGNWIDLGGNGAY